jgi:hypothetical protein
MQTSFGPGESSGLASVVIVVRMTVTPIPICPLIPHFDFNKWSILPVPLAEIGTIGTVFIVIPVVIVLVITVIDAVAVIVVTTVLFLTPVVLRLACCAHYGWRSQGCGKNEKTEQVLMTTLHVVFSRLRTSCSESLALQGVCGVRPGSDVRFRTQLELFGFIPARTPTLTFGVQFGTALSFPLAEDCLAPETHLRRISHVDLPAVPQ